MNSSDDHLDRLISETLKSIHGRALQDGLANSYRTLDTVGRGTTVANRHMKWKRSQVNSLFAVAASIALVVSIGIPIFNSSQASDNPKKLKSTSKTDKTTTSIPENKNNVSTTSNPLVVDPGNVTTTTLRNSSSQITTPFISTPSTLPSTTTPTNVLQNARISYSNTRANSIPLEGATISGNVYIFYDDPNIFSVSWWLDLPGVWDQNLTTRSGEKQPQDFNYRVNGITPKPYDTSQLSVGEHTMGIRTRTFSNQYTKYTIKFFVTR